MPSKQESPARSDGPLDVDDAKRALSVRLFLAVFIPAAVTIGGVELTLLAKTSEIAAGVQSAQKSADTMDQNVANLAKDVKALRETDVPDLKTKIAVLTEKFDHNAKSP